MVSAAAAAGAALRLRDLPVQERQAQARLVPIALSCLPRQLGDIAPYAASVSGQPSCFACQWQKGFLGFGDVIAQTSACELRRSTSQRWLSWLNSPSVASNVYPTRGQRTARISSSNENEAQQSRVQGAPRLRGDHHQVDEHEQRNDHQDKDKDSTQRHGGLLPNDARLTRTEASRRVGAGQFSVNEGPRALWRGQGAASIILKSRQKRACFLTTLPNSSQNLASRLPPSWPPKSRTTPAAGPQGGTGLSNRLVL